MQIGLPTTGSRSRYVRSLTKSRSASARWKTFVDLPEGWEPVNEGNVKADDKIYHNGQWKVAAKASVGRQVDNYTIVIRKV